MATNNYIWGVKRVLEDNIKYWAANAVKINLDAIEIKLPKGRKQGSLLYILDKWKNK